MSSNIMLIEKTLKAQLSLKLPEWKQSGFTAAQIDIETNELKNTIEIFYMGNKTKLKGISRINSMLIKKYDNELVTEVRNMLMLGITKITNEAITSLVIALEQDKNASSETILGKVRAVAQPIREESVKRKNEAPRRAPLAPVTPTSANVSRQLSTVVEGDETLESDEPRKKKQKNRI